MSVFQLNPFTSNLDLVGSSGGPHPTILTLSGENGAHEPPSGNNFNFSGSTSGGSSANGAILFHTTAAGEMDAAVQVDGVTVTINASNKLQAINSLSWSLITANTPAVKGHGYFTNAAMGPAGLTVTLPTTSAVGDTFAVYSFASSGWEIGQNAGQFIQVGQQATTTGVGGNIISTATGDTVTLVCSVANTQWEAVAFDGNLLIN